MYTTANDTDKIMVAIIVIFICCIVDNKKNGLVLD